MKKQNSLYRMTTSEMQIMTYLWNSKEPAIASQIVSDLIPTQNCTWKPRSVFNTVKLGKSMQSIGMLTVLDQVWNRITRNRVLGRRTWVFTDEFQQLLGNKDCTDFYFQLSSRARKWGAILTSITQHVRSVLDNEDARRMLSDCGYIKLLNQSPDDANDLARLLHISNEEKRYIENADVGSGLLIVSKTVVPFNNDFPKDTELFRLMDTSPNRKPSEKG